MEWEVTMSSNEVPRQDISNFSKLILTQAHNIHTTILGREIDLEYGQWLDHYKPKLSEETAEFLKRVRGKSFKEFVETKKKREIFTETLRGLFSSGELLMIPTTPGQAPQSYEVDDTFLLNQRRLYAIAEVAGLAQLTLPVVNVNGAPMGVSLLALPGEDRLLFDAAARWFM
ncbi:amidase family protein [Enterovibrio coralii]|uniref:amidase family protein n=1 Tax=Enterovibrio coralii TaxID=294935 RepID=UPI001E3C1A4D|nr:amidase family protein [Enterovibrio coralii]